MPPDRDEILRGWKDPRARAPLAPGVEPIPAHPSGRRLLQASFAHTPEVPGEPLDRARFLDELRPVGTPDGERRAAAMRRLEEWLRATRTDPAWLDTKLARLSLDREGLLAILAGGAAPAGADARWRQALDEVLAGRDGAEALPDGALVRADDEHPGRPFLFHGFLRPFLQVGARRLREGLALLGPAGARFTPPARADLLRGLAAQLANRATPALILELHTARLEGTLEGATPAERYTWFAEHVCAAPAFLAAVARTYPVLARSLAETVDRWVETAVELAARFHGDEELLAREILGGARPGAVVSLETGLSDPHHGGRSVVRLELAGGARIMYKPRPLTIDARFFALLGWLNGLGIAHPHAILGIVDRGAYGWMEFADAAPCADAAAVERFYTRQGSLLALLYLVRGGDFHYQNVIARGEHPVLLDLEAILSPRFPMSGARTEALRAAATSRGSVLETGLVLRPVKGPDGRDVDLSGLGGGDEQRVIRPGVVDAYTDVMRIAPRERSIPPGKNRPVLDGRPASARAHVGAIVAGFRESYDAIVTARDELAAALRACADVEVRFIPRQTQRYGILAQESSHPDYLRDALDTEALLDILHLEVHVLPVLGGLIAAEQRDLRRGDFPRFTARPGSRDLHDGGGGRVEGFFERSSLDETLARLADAGAEDREIQVQTLVAELGGGDLQAGSAHVAG